MSRRIAIAQMTSTSSVEQNLRQASDLISQARLSNAVFMCLPENFDYLVDDPHHAVSLSSSLYSNPVLSRYHNMAVQADMWLSLGGMQILSNQDPSRLHKVHLILSPHDPTTPVSAYRKLHLNQDESVNTIAGDSLVVAYDTPIGNVGLSVGSDLHYPSLFDSLREANAHVLLTPSVVSTGHPLAHQWSHLLHARAIDNQCYVAAAAQVGYHSPARPESLGHSMIINPLGETLTDTGRMGTAFACADINLDLIQQVREKLPVRKLRRDDVLGKINRAGHV